MAGNVNAVFLQGRLTRDPELRYTPGGTAVCDLRLASTRYYRDSNDEQQEETVFVSVTVWGRNAENCGEYLSKGKETIVEGRLQLDEWETQDGENRSQLKIVANNVQFLGGGDGPPGSGGSQGNSRQTGSPQPASGSTGNGQQSQVNDAGSFPDEENEDDDFSDIPF